MKAQLCTLGTLAALVLAAPATAAAPPGPMGIAIGNTLIADYGDQGKVIGNFNADGTVDWTFPDGKKSHQRWMADNDYFCTVEATPKGAAFSYRCERNMLAGKKLGQHWQYVDSKGAPVTIVVKPRDG